MSIRSSFYQHLAPTSTSPLALDVAEAKGSFIYNTEGKAYLDFISGIAVSNLGHQCPAVTQAIHDQADKYLHTMVFGEYIQAPQVQYAELLVQQLPANLNAVYFTNSGAEATEGAMKLAKRVTGRSEFICFNLAYHGSTQGALSIAGSTNYQEAFLPLLPNIKVLPYNDIEALSSISSTTAAVFIEPIQGEAGARVATAEFLDALHIACSRVGALLVYDECQTGLGRTGRTFQVGMHGVVPDVLLLGKALGGGLPLGAFIADSHYMKQLSFDPALGHITTFGGHPLSCAAGFAAFQFLLQGNLLDEVANKNNYLLSKLKLEEGMQFTGQGLLLALHLPAHWSIHCTIAELFKRGILTDWFLYCDTAIRLAPPLTISYQELDMFIQAFHEVSALFSAK